MKAVILAGGKGSRLYPYTTILPKPLMPIGEIPILEHLFRRLKTSGITDVVLAIGYLGELIEVYYGNGSKIGMNITYSRETTPLGTAAPITLLSNTIKEAFLVMNGDLLCDVDFEKLVKFHYQEKPEVTIGSYNKSHKMGLGVLDIDENSQLIGYREKPEHNYLVSMGIYVMEPTVFQYLEQSKKADLPDLINMLIKNKQKVITYEHKGFWLDIGTHKDYEIALTELSHNPDFCVREIV